MYSLSQEVKYIDIWSEAYHSLLHGSSCCSLTNKDITHFIFLSSPFHGRHPFSVHNYCASLLPVSSAHFVFIRGSTPYKLISHKRCSNIWLSRCNIKHTIPDYTNPPMLRFNWVVLPLSGNPSKRASGIAGPRCCWSGGMTDLCVGHYGSANCWLILTSAPLQLLFPTRYCQLSKHPRSTVGSVWTVQCMPITIRFSCSNFLTVCQVCVCVCVRAFFFSLLISPLFPWHPISTVAIVTVPMRLWFSFCPLLEHRV